MSPEEKAKLDNLYELVKENNELLRSIRRSARFSLAWKIFYWVLIIGLSLGAFHFFQSYLGVLTDATGDKNSLSQQLRELAE